MEKFHHYCFTKKVDIITDYKPLVAMVNKTITTLSQWLQCFMLHLHQDSVHKLYKLGPDLYVTDLLFHHNYMKKRGKEIAGMSISIHTLSTAVDVPVCTLIEDIRAAMKEDAELQILQAHIIKGWPQNKDETESNVGGFWPIRHDLAMVNGVAMKCK